MQFKKSITLLVTLIAILSIAASGTGVFSGWGVTAEKQQFLSQRGEVVELYGKGIYKNDSVSIASQGIAQDAVSLLVGIPLLLLSLRVARKGSLKGLLMLTGTIGYFLYSYISYSFLSMYNQLFLIYVALMSLCLFAFVLCIMSINAEGLKNSFHKKLPVGFIGGFQIFVAFMLTMLWLGKIIPALLNGGVPAGLEHYTTLVIQAMDLGIIIPAAILAGVLLIKRNTYGYLLTSIIMVKEMTMLTALTAMIISQVVAGVKLGVVEMILFPLFNLVAVYCLYLLLRNIDEKKYSSKAMNATA